MPRARALEDEMADVLFVMLLAALFAMTAGAIAVCDRLLGVDDTVATVPVVEDGEAQAVAA